jgi:hypothetical protein
VDLRVPFLHSAGLNVPLLGSTFVILFVLVLLWPLQVFLRRRRGAPPLEPRTRRAAGLTRVGVALGLVYLLGWAAALVLDVPSTVGGERWIRLIQVIGVGCLACALASPWNLWLDWRGGRGAWRIIQSTLAALALLFLAWFSFAFHLISLRIN